ncbi:MAG: helix-turn-helix domain-containing protein [Oscillospiraceae bacterium]|nr:helix-turn-helix domain-containing protein [Oscillospiraceae bacterium]
MNIGINIKKLRRERCITQEQLAEYLNISVSAVSQWECGKTAPDISQLPILANIFKVSADVILGINVDLKEKRIEEIYMSALHDSFDGYRERAFDKIKKGLEEYPDSYRLKSTLAYGFKNVYEWDDGLTLREIIFLCQKVIDDNEIGMDAIELACYEYLKAGRLEEAERLAKSLPIYQHTGNELLTQVYTGNKLTDQLKINIMALNSLLVCNILDLTDQKHDDDEKLILCQKVLTIMETVFEDGNYCYHSQSIRIAHSEMLKIYANRNDTENSLTQLELVAKYAVMFDTYDQEGQYNSILFKGMKTGGYWKESPDDRHSKWILEKISKPNYDFIRENPRFIAVETLLKRHAL